jgi:hypothetical protein
MLLLPFIALSPSLSPSITTVVSMTHAMLCYAIVQSNVLLFIKMYPSPSRLLSEFSLSLSRERAENREIEPDEPSNSNLTCGECKTASLLFYIVDCPYYITYTRYSSFYIPLGFRFLFVCVNVHIPGIEVFVGVQYECVSFRSILQYCMIVLLSHVSSAVVPILRDDVSELRTANPRTFVINCHLLVTHRHIILLPSKSHHRTVPGAPADEARYKPRGSRYYYMVERHPVLRPHATSRSGFYRLWPAPPLLQTTQYFLPPHPVQDLFPMKHGFGILYQAVSCTSKLDAV